VTTGRSAARYPGHADPQSCFARPIARLRSLLRIQQISGGQLEIQQRSLYPALYRLEHQGLICSDWGESDNKRKAKFYRLTAAGRRQLLSHTKKWNNMAALVASILRTSRLEI
jgi:PadR family transcriptional regulator, regulatory protein PadR